VVYAVKTGNSNTFTNAKRARTVSKHIASLAEHRTTTGNMEPFSIFILGCIFGACIGIAGALLLDHCSR
jgi:hypothetical protein